MHQPRRPGTVIECKASRNEARPYAPYADRIRSVFRGRRADRCSAARRDRAHHVLAVACVVAACAAGLGVAPGAVPRQAPATGATGAGPGGPVHPLPERLPDGQPPGGTLLRAAAGT